MDNGPDWIKPEEMPPPKHKDLLVYLIDSQFSERNGIYMGGLLDGIGSSNMWWVRYTEGSFPIPEHQTISHWRFLPNPPDK